MHLIKLSHSYWTAIDLDGQIRNLPTALSDLLNSKELRDSVAQSVKIDGGLTQLILKTHSELLRRKLDAKCNLLERRDYELTAGAQVL